MYIFTNKKKSNSQIFVHANITHLIKLYQIFILFTKKFIIDYNTIHKIIIIIVFFDLNYSLKIKFAFF